MGGWSCAWRALAGAGALQALAAGTLSMAAARGRRGALAAGGAAAHASLMLALLRWRAARTDLALPAVAAAAWGACAALWDVLQVCFIYLTLLYKRYVRIQNYKESKNIKLT